MDDLTYNYYSGTNRLEYVEDIVDPDNYTTDIDDQNTGNYTYDEIGNLKSDAQEGISDIAWTVYGKIKSITKTGSGDHLEFKYDAQGNRIAKIAKPGATLSTPSTWTTTYYTRDAQGNILATYEDKENISGLFLMEQNLYGSNRIGIMRRDIDLLDLPAGGEGHYSGTRGKKAFELSNHLGNVLAVVSDQKKGIDDTGSDGIADYYIANVRSATDYYAFGAPMPGRSFNSTSYRYGFNGKENDREVIGTGSGTQDYGFRIYNPSLGRFLSVDPLTPSYPMLTPYQFASNRPIDGIDLDGLEYQKASSIKLSVKQYSLPMIGVVSSISIVPGVGIPSYYRGKNQLPLSYSPSGQHDLNGTISQREYTFQPEAPEFGVSGKNGTNPYLPADNTGIGALLDVSTKILSTIADNKNLFINPDKYYADNKLSEDISIMNKAIATVKNAIDANGLKIDVMFESDLINFINDGTLPSGNNMFRMGESEFSSGSSYDKKVMEIGKRIFDNYKDSYTKENNIVYVKDYTE